MSNLSENLIKECRRQEESCLYTSTTLYIWLREARVWRGVFVVVPIVLGAVASWSILKNLSNVWIMWLTAAAGLIAGISPAIREALNLDIHVDEIAKHAARFKNLQDRFRLAADTGLGKPETDFENEVRELLELLNEARQASVTPPERCFIKAKEKIETGHYSFTVDEQSK